MTASKMGGPRNYEAALNTLQSGLNTIKTKIDHNGLPERILAEKAHALAIWLGEEKTCFEVIPPHKICEALDGFWLRIELQHLNWDSQSFIDQQKSPDRSESAINTKMNTHKELFAVFSGYIVQKTDHYDNTHNAFNAFKEKFGSSKTMEEGMGIGRKIMGALIPYFSPKNPIKNHNLNVDFLTKKNPNEKIACRHLATAWALDYIDQGKSIPFTDENNVQKRNPEQIEHKFNNIINHGQDCYLVRNDNLGYWLTNQFTRLTSEQNCLAFLLCTKTHAMAIGIKLKIKSNQPIYTVHFFDPNTTTNHIRLTKTNPEYFSGLDLSDLIPPDSYFSYYGCEANHSLLVALPPTGKQREDIFSRKENTPTKRTLTNYTHDDFKGISRDALSSILKYGLGDLQLYRDLFSSAEMETSHGNKETENYRNVIRAYGTSHVDLWMQLEQQQLTNKKSTPAVDEFRQHMNCGYKVLSSIFTIHGHQLSILKAAKKHLSQIDASLENGWDKEAIAALSALKISIIDELDKNAQPIEPTEQPSADPVPTLPPPSQR